MKLGLWLGLLLFVSGSAGAQGIVVPVAYRNVANEYNIPPKVFFAIAMQESQRKLSNGQVLPWPWTLNIQGQGHHYNNSEKMREALYAAIDNGVTNVDIGAMQVNYRWHFAKSYSLDDLMRPEDNLNIAAIILATEHRRCGGGDLDWMCAVGHYHSYTEEMAEAYTEKVMRWFRDLR